jgi:hypothetical protein
MPTTVPVFGKLVSNMTPPATWKVHEKQIAKVWIGHSEWDQPKL